MNQPFKLALCVCLLAALCLAEGHPPIAIPFGSKVKLTASDGAANDQFGWSVAISSNGRVVAVGTPFHNINGAAYVFVKSGASWTNATQTAELTVSNPSLAEFGDCIAITGNGDTIAVGAPGANEDQGAVYIFAATGGNPANGYTQAAELTSSVAVLSNFGCGLAISSNGETVAVGGGVITNQYQGAVYVFTEPSTGWSGTVTPDATLTASDAVANQNLGSAVSISGNTIAAGADDGFSGGLGAVYVFTKSGTNWISGTQTAKLTASDGASLDQLGESVSISGNTIVAGAPRHTVGSNADEGALYVFVEPAAGGWINSTQTAELTASKGGAGSFLGYSVTIRGTIVVGGAYGQQVGSNTGQGEVFAYEKPKTGWVNRTENFNLTASGGKAGDELGWSTGIAGLVGVSGARGYSNASFVGAVYVFQAP